MGARSAVPGRGDHVLGECAPGRLVDGAGAVEAARLLERDDAVDEFGVEGGRRRRNVDVQLGEARAERGDIGAGRPVGKRPGGGPKRHGERAAGQLDPGGERADAGRRHHQPDAGTAARPGDLPARATDDDRERRRRRRSGADDQRCADECDADAGPRLQLGRDRQPLGRRADHADPRAQHACPGRTKSSVETACRVGSRRRDPHPALGRAPLDDHAGSCPSRDERAAGDRPPTEHDRSRREPEPERLRLDPGRCRCGSAERIGDGEDDCEAAGAREPVRHRLSRAGRAVAERPGVGHDRRRRVDDGRVGSEADGERRGAARGRDADRRSRCRRRARRRKKHEENQ